MPDDERPTARAWTNDQVRAHMARRQAQTERRDPRIAALNARIRGETTREPLPDPCAMPDEDTRRAASRTMRGLLRDQINGGYYADADTAHRESGYEGGDRPGDGNGGGDSGNGAA